MTNQIQEIIQHGIDNLEGQQADSVYGGDLHHELYNMDYFIIGYYNAEQFLEKYGSFKAIGEVQKYEQDNFGEVTTDLSDSEKVVNMLAYIKGEEALYNCDTLNRRTDKILSQEELNTIKEELEEQL